MQTQSLPGFRDFFPEDLAFRTHIFSAMRRVALRYGFEEYDGPPLESLELYTKKSGEEIVGQLYNFEDKGGRVVALRPEMTPTLARMVSAKANGLKKPIRWFTIPQLFRYERQQRGRLREHFQLNCDIVGEAGPQADAEIIALAIDVMRELGLGPTDIRVRVSDRRVLKALLTGAGVDEAQLPRVYQAIDRIEKDPSGGLAVLAASLDVGTSPTGRHMTEEVLRVIRITDPELLWDELSRVPESGAGEPLRETLDALEAMGLGEFVDLDLTIVRGLAYYTGTVFELFDAGRTLRAVCGGGRYDDLLRSIGGVDLPALGFGMGDVVLGELLKERGLSPALASTIDVFVAHVTAEERSMALGISHRLRDAGFRVEHALNDTGLGKQLKLANSRGARLAVVVGPDDRVKGEAVLRDLIGGEQHPVPAGTVVEAVRRTLATTPEKPLTHEKRKND